MSEAVKEKTVAELYLDSAAEFDLKAKRETSPQMKAFYAGRAREERQRANEWHQAMRRETRAAQKGGLR